MRLIDADKVIKKLREHKKLFCRNQIEFSMLPPDQKARADEIDTCIGELINAEPIDTEPHWILCSERMPEEHEWIGTKRFGTTISDEVYVTFENPKGERFCTHISFQNGKVSGYDQRVIDAIYKGSRPVAWKPQPEAYKGAI